MRAIFLLAVGAAALKAPKQTALAVRGGGEPKSPAPKKLVCRYASASFWHAAFSRPLRVNRGHPDGATWRKT